MSRVRRVITDEQAIADVLRDLPAVPNSIAIPKPTPRPRRAPKPLRARPNPVPVAVREAVLDRANRVCEWCGVPGGHLIIHHKLLRSQGGRHRVEDCAAVHQRCHEQIHASPAEARRRGLIIGAGAKE
jgi:HNH endonuclease